SKLFETAETSRPPHQGGAHFTALNHPVNRLSEDFSKPKTSTKPNGCLSIPSPPDRLAPRKRCAFYRLLGGRQQGF
ncbi:hypothetical protein, partial [Marinobacter xestospongiae]|uniref:hypothetical protein n=1 Tax=Marinobacter xestospongiae TaxID=994319 RepID=UPI0031D85531